MHNKYYKNWKTVGNNGYFHIESENPILKKDEHHAEIVDISDGLVVEDKLLINYDYELDNENIIWDNLKHHQILKKDCNIWDAFSTKKI